MDEEPRLPIICHGPEQYDLFEEQLRTPVSISDQLNIVQWDTTPSLPTEIWQIVFSYMGGWTTQRDLIYRWMTLRNVCRAFKSEVEATFRRYHMGLVNLHFDLG